MIQHEQQPINYLSQVMRWNTGSHPHSNARCTVHEHVGYCSRKHHRFIKRIIKIAYKIHCIPVKLIEDIHRNRSQAGLGITHRSGRVAIHAAKVPLTIHQHITHAEILRQARHGFVNCLVSMRMVFSQHLTNNSC